MQTSPVLNTLAPAQPQANKSADASASTDSFNQVLTREIADRRSASEAPAAQEADAKNSAKPVANNGKQETKASDADKPADDSDSSTSDMSDAAAATSDMLALVASINQANVPAAPAASQPASTDTASIGIASDTPLHKGKPGTDRAIPAHGDSIATEPEAATRTQADSATDATAGNADTHAAPATDKPAPDFAHALDKASSADKTSAPNEATETAAAKPAELSDATLKPAQDFTKVKDPIAQAETKPELATEAKETTLAATALPLQQMPQPALNNLTHMTAAHASDRLSPQVGTPAWDQALGQKVTWMIAGEQQSASLTLNPPDLGPLQVVLNVTNSHANATFVAAQPEVRQALEAAMPRLRDMLGDAGIQLGQATVSSGSPGQQGAPDQPPQQGRRADFSTVRFDTPIQATRVQAVSSGVGLVDTFV